MINRLKLKEQAKDILRSSYWKAFIVSLILAIITGSGGNSGRESVQNEAGHSFESVIYDVKMGSSNFQLDLDIGSTIGALLLFMLIFVVAMAVYVLITGVLEVGCRKYFLHATKKEFSLNHLVFGFKKGQYLNIALTILLRNVYIFLWSLLLIVPGIIKSYAYRMVPYIMAENPTLPPSQALAMSEDMTRGHKWDMFVLDLSFIGWYLLGALCFGIGTLFVLPYHNQTLAGVYVTLNPKDREAHDIEEDEWESIFDE